MLQIPWHLLKAYVQGDITELESNELKVWLKSEISNQLIFDEVVNDNDQRENLIANRWKNSNADWGNVISRIKLNNNLIKLPKRKLIFIAVTAASVLFLVGISIGLLYDRIWNSAPRLPDGYSYIYSPRGQRTKVVLPDRTRVWLNSESSLRYAADYNVQDREVILEGEAFFEVTKNHHKPFLVNANEIKVKVYGTSFNLKAFPDDKFIETTLVKGKLSVIPKASKGGATKEIYLKPNETCLYERMIKKEKQKNNTENQPSTVREPIEGQNEVIVHVSGTIILEKNINPESRVSWKEGKLIFKNETFGDLAVKLERWFDIKIHFENEEIRNFRFTGVFEKETVDQALEALRLSSKKSYQYNMVYRDVYLK